MENNQYGPNTQVIYIPNPSPKLIAFIKERQEVKRVRMEEIRKKYEQELNP